MNGRLTFEAVTKTLGGRNVLDRLSLSVRAGEVFALDGPNGAGKTTTLNVALGFLIADAGRVRVEGQDVSLDPVRALQSMAYLPEQVALYPDLSGIENLRYFTLVAGLDLSRSRLRGVRQV